MSLFPWLIVLLLTALIAELIVVGPRAVRSLLRGEGLRIELASVRALLALVLIQIVLVAGWLLLVKGRLV